MENGYIFSLGGNTGGGGGGESTIAWKPNVNADGDISWTRSNSTTAPATQNIKGDPGEKGDPGSPGENGQPGDDGFSPVVNVTETDTGHIISIEDKDGAKEFEVSNGKDMKHTALVTNAQNFKLDITKNHTSWYGFLKLEYLYGTTLCEASIGISTSEISYIVTKGTNHIDKITYTTNGANIVLGIDFKSKVYGTQVVEMANDFGVINSLTAETYTGDTNAIYKGCRSMYSYSSLAELGLDTTATINDIIGNMANNSIFVYKTDAFDLSEYENLQYATVTIIKQSNARVQIFMTDKNTGGLYIPYFSNDGKFGGWISYVSRDSNHLYKVFNNQNGSTAKWFKVTNAPAQDGKSYTVKLSAQRIIATGHIEYVSVSRDNSNNDSYTNAIVLQEKAGGNNPSEASASYLVVDANNELWLKVASYAYATIELSTPNTAGSFTIDGSEGTPVAPYKFNTFEKRN